MSGKAMNLSPEDGQRLRQGILSIEEEHNLLNDNNHVTWNNPSVLENIEGYLIDSNTPIDRGEIRKRTRRWMTADQLDHLVRHVEEQRGYARTQQRTQERTRAARTVDVRETK